MSDDTILFFGGVASPPPFVRPPPTTHKPLPPFDPDDAGGDVHRVPPPELVIPTGPDNLFLRADFTGVCLDLARWGFRIDFNHNWLIGANSTPFNMLMTPMAPMYAQPVRDAMLTEHAERNYTHFVVASGDWNMPENGFSWSPAQFVAWCAYLRSWGFFVVYWGPAIHNDPFLAAAVNAGVIDWHIVGKEVESSMTAEAYESVLDAALLITANGCPSAAHFSLNYPKGFPADTFFDGRSMKGWDAYNGRVHLMWQANSNELAGMQGANLYYARERVNLGAVEGNGRLALNSRVYAFETMATAQLYGRCTEEYGNLRDLELLYTTRRDDRIRPVSGFGNGARYPDGRPI